MKPIFQRLINALALFGALHQAAAQGTAFTYQGRLTSGGGAVTGSYDLTFTLFNTNSGGTAAVSPVTNSAIAVSNGLFTATIDFGAAAFNGSNDWLEIAVRTNGNGSFSTLSPRQGLTPTPYAITAENLTGVVENNTVTGGQYATVGGGINNASSGLYDTVGGGSANTSSGFEAATVGGGYQNKASGNYATVGGGYFNTSSGDYSTVAGGELNTSSNVDATVAGGYFNTSGGEFATVGGGYLNNSSANFATVSGGALNVASGAGAVVGGGGVEGANGSTQQGSVASGLSSTISGGIANNCSGNFATVCGGANNTSSGFASTVCGGDANTASGSYSFAAGNGAQAGYDGSFVWSDDTGGNFSATGANQFDVRANGGFQFTTSAGIQLAASGGSGITFAGDLHLGTSSADYHHFSIGGGNSYGYIYGSYPAFADGIHMGYNYYADSGGVGRIPDSGGGTSRISAGFGEVKLEVGNINSTPNILVLDATTSGVSVYGTFNNNSDRNAKQDFTTVSPAQILNRVLQLPVSEWSYKTDATTRHLGPVAQDFYSVFNLGTDDKHIAPIDEGGVALAAIQGLNLKLTEKEAEIQNLERQLKELQEIVKHLAAQK